MKGGTHAALDVVITWTCVMCCCWCFCPGVGFFSKRSTEVVRAPNKFQRKKKQKGEKKRRRRHKGIIWREKQTNNNLCVCVSFLLLHNGIDIKDLAALMSRAERSAQFVGIKLTTNSLPRVDGFWTLLEFVYVTRELLLPFVFGDTHADDFLRIFLF